MDDDEELPSEFTGFVINSTKDNCLVTDQSKYLKNLECFPTDATFKQFRSMRMKLVWLAKTRPDCLFEISQLSQITEDKLDSKQASIKRRLNKAVKYAVDNLVPLRIIKLQKDTLKVIDFSDSSFANNEDLSSQLGHIVFLGDSTSTLVRIHFKSYKSKRVTRSAILGEVIAFSDMFDIALSFAQELQDFLSEHVPVEILTDSKSLSDVIFKGSRTSEKRTMFDIAAARECLRDKLISDIGFVRGSRNVADGLTKVMSQALLRNVINTGETELQPEQ